MLFNSIEFAIFLPIVFSLYWLLSNYNRAQNLLILIASYIFYGWWDPRFLILIVISSSADYFIGIALKNTDIIRVRKIYLLASLMVNLGILFFFKYFNFFAESFVQAFSLLGKPFEINRLKIILPVGISFYTFQTLSYTIDVYNRKIEPTRDILAFFTFVSFFPQLVAGPIERAKNLLPQFKNSRQFSYIDAKSGLRQILYGLFKKIVIADNCAVYADRIFESYDIYPGSMLLLGSVYFAFQIYCDFSGYSDIAIGTARLFGFHLMQNFNFPYFSRDIAEFWRRWHISLSTWFRDYVYIPLGGSKTGIANKIRNIIIVFTISGLWHGANWTFVFWGLLNALLYFPLLLFNWNRANTGTVAQGRYLPSFKEFILISFTFLTTCMAWVFFRATDLQHAFSYLTGMLNSSLFKVPTGKLYPLAFIAILVFIEWFQRNKKHALDFEDVKLQVPFRWAVYYSMIITIFWFGGVQQEFIYFQF